MHQDIYSFDDCIEGCGNSVAFLDDALIENCRQACRVMWTGQMEFKLERIPNLYHKANFIGPWTQGELSHASSVSEWMQLGVTKWWKY